MDYYTSINYRPDHKRKQRDGSIKIQPRYVLSYRMPGQTKVKHEFHERKKDALKRERELILSFETGDYTTSKHQPTIGEGFDLWIKDRIPHVKAPTLQGYLNNAKYIKGPLLDGTREQRFEHTLTGITPPGTSEIPMLGDKKATELTTADIRAWHKLLWDKVGPYTANQAKQYLSAILGLLAEDYNIKPPAIPKRIEKHRKQKKQILTQDQFKTLLEYAQKDEEYGLYYAFPFLTGVRCNELLGLLWTDLDFEKRVIHIRRIQERDGSITDFTKTEAGMRDIPMSSMLHDWLLKWQEKCPVAHGHPPRVFPNLGTLQQWPKPRIGGGKCLLYANYRRRVWDRALQKAGLPHVTPHSARHFFISTLQAKEVEVGLVAKLAGHSNPVVTLGHYTQAVRGGEEAMEKLVG